MATDDSLPLPPRRLVHRVGCPRGTPGPLDLYVARGREVRDAIVEALPPGWSFEGRRALDFGCGAGRVLRHFLDEASTAELWGCDIHRPSIEWLAAHLCPPLHAFHHGDSPPLDQPDASFDLAWALSVFTHITDTWSAWLLELHRVLRPDGLLLVTFMGETASEWLAGEPWDEDRVGMNVLRPANPWDRGGPMVLHSPWWITAHWGRAFEILTLRPFGFSRQGRVGQGWVLMRKRPVELTPEDLERPEPGEPRELAALRHNVRQLGRELVTLESSRSWRLTRPLRELSSVWGARRRRPGARGAGG
ncbi:MAG TPA: class I SAM-dependent methyltransferase [Acidimicrobiales bacterium]|nr:class I SAM-dependent methyltransferase [Acidimicrobiales bacterium]